MRALLLLGTLLAACASSFALTRLLQGAAPGATSAGSAGAALARPAAHGDIDILLDGPDLFVDLDVPATTLLGFAHAPTSRREHEAMVRAHRLLDSGELLRLSSAARCTLTDAYATVGHGYDDLCSGATHLDGDVAGATARAWTPAEPIATARGTDARDVSARWSWFCDAPERLARIELRLFDAFEGIERLDAFAETPDGTLKTHLDEARPTLPLERISPLARR